MNLIYGEIVDVFAEDGRMGKIRVGGAMSRVALATRR